MRFENTPQKRKPRVYFASPLFSAAEKQFNEDVTRDLESYFQVYLPQRDGGLMVEMIERGTPPSVAAQRVFDADVRAIMDCDVLIAVLDGRSVDEGVAFELGLAFANRKACFGLQTDVRRLLPSGNNPMIARALGHVFMSAADLLDWARCYCSTWQAKGEERSDQNEGRVRPLGSLVPAELSVMSAVE